MSNGTPFVEYYRPTNFNNIILSPLNKCIFENIIKTKCFPNMLFYGPPGTGKTTTIINLIETFQQTHHQKNSSLIIHLNASDERGIDTIRNQIYNFVKSNALFCVGMKFVILDEVDYMTKTAQQALRNLLQTYNNVRFCLICNYINRIEDGLQNEFIKFRFNQLPTQSIVRHLTYICKNESIHLTKQHLTHLQEMFHSDIRSMINYIQLRQNIHENKNIISHNIYEKLIAIFIKSTPSVIYKRMLQISNKYNLNHINLIKNYVTYLVKHSEHITQLSHFLLVVKELMHSTCDNDKTFNMYTIHQLKKYIK